MLEWAPFLTILQQVYSSYPQECNVLMDTALSLIGVAFTFIVLPAGDLLLGQDTLGPEAVSFVMADSAQHPRVRKRTCSCGCTQSGVPALCCGTPAVFTRLFSAEQQSFVVRGPGMRFRHQLMLL